MSICYIKHFFVSHHSVKTSLEPREGLKSDLRDFTRRLVEHVYKKNLFGEDNNLTTAQRENVKTNSRLFVQGDLDKEKAAVLYYASSQKISDILESPSLSEEELEEMSNMLGIADGSECPPYNAVAFEAFAEAFFRVTGRNIT